MTDPTKPDPELLSLLKTLAAVGAPTFQEKRRSDFIREWLGSKLNHLVESDELGNVWIDFSEGADSVCLIDAHMDTVSPLETVPIREEGDHLAAPGIFDNTVACAMLMLWAARQGARRRPILVSFTVGEEGEGNLCGIRAVVKRFRSRIRQAWVFDLGLRTASVQAVGSYRARLTWKTSGGHSWAHFGQPSAVHEMSRWIARLETDFPWRSGTHSYNIGRVQGGEGINVIASSAELILDVRSVEPAFLQHFADWLTSRGKPDTNGVAVEIFELGVRPAGNLPPDQPMLNILRDVHAQLAIPLNFGIYSSNGNLLLGEGIPTVVTGLAVGSGVHTEAEYLELSSLPSGFQKLTRILEALPGLLSAPGEISDNNTADTPAAR
jgi:tripeptide aminopeptidase